MSYLRQDLRPYGRSSACCCQFNVGKLLAVLLNVLISWIVSYLNHSPGSSGRISGLIFQFKLPHLAINDSKCEQYKLLFSMETLGFSSPPFFFASFKPLQRCDLWIQSTLFFEMQLRQQQCGDISPSKKSNIRFSTHKYVIGRWIFNHGTEFFTYSAAARPQLVRLWVSGGDLVRLTYRQCLAVWEMS